MNGPWILENTKISFLTQQVSKQPRVQHNNGAHSQSPVSVPVAPDASHCEIVSLNAGSIAENCPRFHSALQDMTQACQEAQDH